ncbi:MAG: hypothetical protein FWF54_05620, partial [Candidatus Azobacteroides sp.]|nr:hypothetical protein [Candidatus Azobacteroides sp.]
CNTIIDLQNNISNFPKLTERSIYFGQPRDLKELPPDALDKARQWMKENKGNYQISERFRPLFGVRMFESYY